MSASSHHPDGLTEYVLDALIAEVDAVLGASPMPTSALMDGTAAARRQRRQTRQAIASGVRALPVVRQSSSAGERGAA